MIKYFRFSKTLISSVFCLSVLGLPAAHAELPPNAVKGGTLTVLSTSEINSLNPAVQSGTATAQPGSQLFASLVMADDKWQFHPYLADSWEKSADGLTYTFKLNQKAVFHDDKPITSEDVAYSLKVVKENHPFGKSMYANLDKVETPDAHTIVVKFSKPTPAFLLQVSTPALLPILPKHIFDTGTPIRTNPYNNKPIGSGPFKFGEYKPGQYLTLEKFDKFFLGAPHLDKVIFAIIKDINAAALSMEQGKVNYTISMPVVQLKSLAKNPELVWTDKGYEGVGKLIWLEFNLIKEGPLQNIKVRQAISYAIDRKFISEKIQGGITTPADGPIYSSSPFYNKKLNPYSVDLDKANKLLDEAGYPKQSNGTRFALTIDFIPASNRDATRNPAEYIRAQLPKIGIDVQLRVSPDFPTWARRVANYDYDFSIDSVFNWGDPTIGVSRTYMSTNIRKGVVFANMSGYKNLKVDALLNEAAVTEDFDKRKALYDEFQEIVNKELPVAWIVAAPQQTIYSKKLINIPLGIWGGYAPFNETAWTK